MFALLMTEVLPKAVHKMVRRDWWRFSSEHNYSAKRQQSRCNSVFHICLGLEGNPCSCDFIPLSCKIYNACVSSLFEYTNYSGTNILHISNCFPKHRELWKALCFPIIVELVNLITRLLKKSKCKSL